MSDLESAILEAAKKNDDRLDSLLRRASEVMEEEQVLRIYDKVEQIMRENWREAGNWEDREGEEGAGKEKGEG